MEGEFWGAAFSAQWQVQQQVRQQIPTRAQKRGVGIPSEIFVLLLSSKPAFDALKIVTVTGAARVAPTEMGANFFCGVLRPFAGGRMAGQHIAKQMGIFGADVL
jgi:hypothetical protein